VKQLDIRWVSSNFVYLQSKLKVRKFTNYKSCAATTHFVTIYVRKETKTTTDHMFFY